MTKIFLVFRKCLKMFAVFWVTFSTRAEKLDRPSVPAHDAEEGR
jgi:hypothetical protein